MHAKRPEDPAPDGQRPPQPARALPAQVKLAGPFYPVRRADRRPAPVTRLSHLAPACRPGCPARCTILTAHHFTSAFPAPAAGAAAGHRAPPPGPELVHAAPVILIAPGRRSAPGSRPGPLRDPARTPRPPSANPLHRYRATAPAARYRTVPESRPWRPMSGLKAPDVQAAQAPAGPGRVRRTSQVAAQL